MSKVLPESRKEVTRAKDCLKKMKLPCTFDEFETYWTNLLVHIEKCWKKAERECQGLGSKFQPWQGNYISKRRKDPLLSYLKAARDSDSHSIQVMIDKTDASTTINFIDPKGGMLKNTTLKIENGKVEIKHEGDPLEVKYNPPRILVKSVTSEGKTRIPPNYHQGKALKDPKDPFEIAELGIKFYENYLDDIEQKFFAE